MRSIANSKNPNWKENAENAKLQNMAELAYLFSAMSRVFSRDSNKKIKRKIAEVMDGFFNVESEEEFRRKHEEFCNWFVEHVKMAKNSQNASWGHAAKVIDISLKVLIYYCNLPDPSKASKIVPWLNAAIDNSLINHIKEWAKKEGILTHQIENIRSLKDIEKKETYDELQDLIKKEIQKECKGGIYPVQYDDIMWRKLNRDEDF